MAYNVAFRGTEASRGAAGIITWCSWADKTTFDGYRQSPKGRALLELTEVVEEGITVERAIELAKSIPIKALIIAAIETVISSNGVLDRGRVDSIAEKTAWVIERRFERV